MPNLSKKELKDYRYDFPITKHFIYLNHASVSPISRRVADAVMEFNEDVLHHGFVNGPEQSQNYEKIRRLCAQLINAHTDEVAFVKNTSHGISLIARGLNFKAGDEIIISEVEFPANVYPWMALEKQGVVLKKIPSKNGELQLDQLENLYNSKTKLISLSSVQYGTGYRLPVAEVGQFCRDHNLYFFLDAIQSLGAFPLDVQIEHVDFLAADAHKWLLGHEGIGIFYIRKELIQDIEPSLIGWNSTVNAFEFDSINYELRKTAERFEEGSPNGLSIYGLGAAVELVLEIGVERIAERILNLTQELITGLKNLGLHIDNSLDPKYRSGIVLCSIPNDPNGEKIIQLERHLFSKKIITSIRRGKLRFSPHFYNSKKEIHKVLREIEGFLDKL